MRAELAVAGRYGWHRDELYYAVAGLHLQGGYVEFPPVTALLAALARELFGWSLVGLRAFTILASAGTVLVGALVARELGATRRAQTLAAVVIGFAPGMLATNLLFQPVALDQLTTMVVLWLALRLALGRGSWPLLGVAAGIGLETKYTLAVVLVLLVATFLVWRRDVLRSWGFPLAVAIAAVLLVPNLVWEAGHGWTSVHLFLNPPPSGSDETRPQFIANVILLAGGRRSRSPSPGVVSLVRDRALRPLGWTVVGTVVAYFVLGGKSYYALPVVVFALAAGAIPLDRWATRRASPDRRRRVRRGRPRRPADPAAGAAAAHGRPARSHQGARRLPVGGRLARVRAPGRAARGGRRRDRRGQLRRGGRARAVRPRPAAGRVGGRDDALLAPAGGGRRALVVGYSRRAASFCSGYRLVARISTRTTATRAASRSRAARCAARSPTSGHRSSRARANERRCSYGRVASPRQGAAWPTPGTLLHAHRATS